MLLTSSSAGASAGVAPGGPPGATLTGAFTASGLPTQPLALALQLHGGDGFEPDGAGAGQLGDAPLASVAVDAGAVERDARGAAVVHRREGRGRANALEPLRQPLVARVEAVADALAGDL